MDAILGELCALEVNFSKPDSVSNPNSVVSSKNGVSSPTVDMPTDPPPPPAPLQLEELLSAEPQYISPESVRQNKAMKGLLNSSKRTDSPDADSAFCENTSSNSSSSSNKQQLLHQQQQQQLLPPPPPPPPSSSASSTLLSSPQVQHDLSVTESSAGVRPLLQAEDAAAKAKAEKIRLAIEKIKEASIKKIFIKVGPEIVSTVESLLKCVVLCPLGIWRGWFRQVPSCGREDDRVPGVSYSGGEEPRKTRHLLGSRRVATRSPHGACL